MDFKYKCTSNVRHLLEYYRNTSSLAREREKEWKTRRTLFDSFSFFFFFFKEESFQQLQRGFMEEHYREFDDSDENKLSYTAIFDAYVSRGREPARIGCGVNRILFPLIGRSVCWRNTWSSS